MNESPMKLSVVEAYLKTGGLLCPACGSANILAGQLLHEAHVPCQDVECHECGATWTDQYALTGFTDLKEG